MKGPKLAGGQERLGKLIFCTVFLLFLRVLFPCCFSLFGCLCSALCCFFCIVKSNAMILLAENHTYKRFPKCFQCFRFRVLPKPAFRSTRKMSFFSFKAPLKPEIRNFSGFKGFKKREKSKKSMEQQEKKRNKCQN